MKEKSFYKKFYMCYKNGERKILILTDLRQR